MNSNNFNTKELIVKVVMLKGDKGDMGIGLPEGGSIGQALKKRSNANFDYEWENIDIPSGGTAGQVLKKRSNTNYDYEWGNADIPEGGSIGQVLAKLSNANYDYGWITLDEPYVFGILEAPQNEITISDASITETSILSFYTSIYGVSPDSVIVANGSVTLTFESQQTNMIVAVKVEGSYQ